MYSVQEKAIIVEDYCFSFSFMFVDEIKVADSPNILNEVEKGFWLQKHWYSSTNFVTYGLLEFERASFPYELHGRKKYENKMSYELFRFSLQA